MLKTKVLAQSLKSFRTGPGVLFLEIKIWPLNFDCRGLFYLSPLTLTVSSRKITLSNFIRFLSILHCWGKTQTQVNTFHPTTCSELLWTSCSENNVSLHILNFYSTKTKLAPELSQFWTICVCLIALSCHLALRLFERTNMCCVVSSATRRRSS